MSDQLEVILTDTRHSGNIGAVARLLKNLGISRLTLVNPTSRALIEAVRMAVGAEEIIENATVVGTLQEGIGECVETFAVTRRPRKYSKSVYDPAEVAARLPDIDGRIGIVFGSEKQGLLNDQVSLCSAILTLPVSPHHPSYNLAQAAAIVLYTVASPSLSLPKQSRKARRDPAPSHEKRLLYDRLIGMGRDAGFFGRSADKPVIAAIEDVFERARLSEKEVKILQGLFKNIQRSMGEQ
jgi:tRNA (cytidine32/uridine32-2'-O)-methyltransferase